MARTPLYALRLAEKTQQDLVAMSKVYGSPTPSAFIREILEVVVSGNIEKMNAFNRRLIMGMGEQMALKFEADLAKLNSLTARKTRKTRTKRKTHERAT